MNDQHQYRSVDLLLVGLIRSLGYTNRYNASLLVKAIPPNRAFLCPHMSSYLLTFATNELLIEKCQILLKDWIPALTHQPPKHIFSKYYQQIDNQHAHNV